MLSLGWMLCNVLFTITSQLIACLFMMGLAVFASIMRGKGCRTAVIPGSFASLIPVGEKYGLSEGVLIDVTTRSNVENSEDELKSMDLFRVLFPPSRQFACFCDFRNPESDLGQISSTAMVNPILIHPQEIPCARFP